MEADAILNSLLPSEPKETKVKTTEMTSIVDSNGEILGINDSDSDSSDEEARKKRPPVPVWATSPYLRQQLQEQQSIDPDHIFSDLVSPNLRGNQN